LTAPSSRAESGGVTVSSCFGPDRQPLRAGRRLVAVVEVVEQVAARARAAGRPWGRSRGEGDARARPAWSRGAGAERDDAPTSCGLSSRTAVT
jgi:hypothetical protein